MVDITPEYFRSIESGLRNGGGLPSELYTDPEWFKLEKAAIFKKRWYYIGPIQKLCNPGDTILGYADDVPVIVCRDRSNELRAHINICRHRGHPVCSEEREHSVFSCPYHGWTYGLDGALRGAPGSREEDGFNSEEYALMSLPVVVWGSMVLVAPDADIAPLEELMPDFEAITKKRGLVTDPNQYSHHRRYQIEMETNWKIYYDNALECYHCSLVHSGTFNDVYATKNDFDTFIGRWLVSYYFPPRPSEVPEKLAITFNRHVHVVPGFFCHQQDDIMIAYQMRAVSPTRTQVHWDIYFDRAGDEKKLEKWCDLWEATLLEDKAAVEAVQRNISTGAFRANRLISNREPALVEHNHWILEDCRAERLRSNIS